MILMKNKETEERHYVDPRTIPISDLAGADEAVMGIKDSLTLLHGTVGCNYFTRCVRTMDTGKDSSTFTCTGLAERDIVYGGEERLRAAIKRAVKVFKPAIICVAGGTVSTLIGDDMAGVVDATQSELAKEGVQIPIISVPTSLFEEGRLSGFNMVSEALVDKVVDEPTQSRSHTVNIFGVMADVANAEADVLEMKRLLGELGIQVQEVFCCGAEVDGIRHASEANLNLVVSEVVGVGAAKKMEQRFGLPFRVLPYPIGITNTKRFLQVTADFLGIEKERVDELIARETETVYKAIRRLMYSAADMRSFPLVGSTAAIAGDSTHVLGVTRCLVEEWGVKPVLVALQTYGETSLEMVTEMEKELGVEIPVLLNPTREQVKQVLEETKPAILLGGNWENLDAREAGLYKTGTTFVHIATRPCTFLSAEGRFDVFPHPFAGFLGVIWLSELIHNEQIRAGWEWIWANFPGESSALEIARQGK